MKYKMLGSTGLNVSMVAIGTWGIGGVGWDEISEADKLDAIAAMLEHGVNIIDTAPAYNAGVAEQIIGKAVKGKRDKVYIATKVGTRYIDGKYIRNTEKKAVYEQCEQSLRDLGMDYIDLYQIHWPVANTPIGETMEALNDLKQQGKIRHVGVSNFSIEQIAEAEKYGKIDTLQIHYSMVNRTAADIAKWAADKNMGVMTYGSLGGGILSGVFRTLPNFPETDNRSHFYKHFKEPMFSKIMKLLDLMDEISASHGGVPLSQIALNWNIQLPFVTTAIIGVRKRIRALENLGGMEWSLSDEEIGLLNKKIADEMEM